MTFSKLPGPVEAFLVGGGGKGGDGAHETIYGQGALQNADKATGGDGGAGGNLVTAGVSLTPGVSYHVTVGQSGTSASAFGLTAAAGARANGAKGAIAYLGNPGASRQPAGAAGDGALAFGTGGTLYEQSLGHPVKFGPGGGGGSAWSYTMYGDTAAPSSGGETGGGDGGNSTVGSPGAANTGAGGGGGAAAGDGGKQGGLGGSGIVILRNVRSNT